jgi:hypothetical protein
MLIVFVTNKIIAMDTILPILVEANECNNQKVIVVVSRKKGLQAIESNVVLNDVVNKIGFKFLFGGRYRFRLYKRIVGSVQFLLLFIAGISGAKFIHFDTLHHIHLKILSKFFASRIYYSERDSIKHDFFKLPHHFKNKFGNNYKEGNFPVPLGGNVISYNKDRLHYYYGYDILKKRKVYFLGPTRTRHSWLKYIDNKSDYYFNKFHQDVDISNGIIVIVLTNYGLDEPLEEDVFSQKKLRKNFENTVNVLSEIKGDIPVFLKAHSYTDIEYVESVLSKRNGFHITYIHPSMLLLVAKFVICNYYSSILGDAHGLGVPTIEYTYYPSYIRKNTGDGSICSDYVDWFIYDNINEFRKVVVDLISQDYNRKQFVKDIKQQRDALLIDLC